MEHVRYPKTFKTFYKALEITQKFYMKIVTEGKGETIETGCMDLGEIFWEARGKGGMGWSKWRQPQTHCKTTNPISFVCLEEKLKNCHVLFSAESSRQNMLITLP